MNETFYINEKYSYQYVDLLKIKPSKVYFPIVKNSKTIEIFKNIIISLIYDFKIILIDSESSDDDLLKIEPIYRTNINKFYNFESIDDLIEHCKNVKNWSITLFTSGSTGTPKKVTHNFEKFKNSLKISKSHCNDVWGFTYNPSHIAGLQVFFQAFFNKNKIVDVFQKNPTSIKKDLVNHSVTHISGTPTFYRLLQDEAVPTIQKVTSGGEKLTSYTLNKIKKVFPNAKILNIYASTEIGTLLLSKNENFIIPETLREKIKIKNHELFIDKKLLGIINEKSDMKWYATGDLVEIVDNDPTRFKFISRKNEMVNVGGMKVNPTEIEEITMQLKGIKQIKVYGMKNKLIGNILCADIINEGRLNKTDIKLFLRNQLQNFKVPRIINFVSEIQTTRTGKIKR